MRDFNITDLQRAVRELKLAAGIAGGRQQLMLAGARIRVVVDCVRRNTWSGLELTTAVRFYVNGKRIQRALLEARIAAGHL